MDAVQQLESELEILDGPLGEAAPDPVHAEPEITTTEEPVVQDEDQEARKFQAASVMADALDELAAQIEVARSAAHSLVAAFSPASPTGYPLTVETTPEEPDDDEVPKKS